MKIIYLLPPSESKFGDNFYFEEKLSFSFKKPLKIAKNASEKDLKCSGKRYKTGIFLNKNIEKSGTTEAIKRYDGVMYSGINFENMNENAKKYFLDNFYILSGMYGILRLNDKIGNYKLPIETKGLYDFWGDKITKTLNKLEADLIIDFLPNSYKKLINKNLLKKKIIEIEFRDKSNSKKLTHGVKKIKGEFIRSVCENNGILINDDILKLGILNIYN